MTSPAATLPLYTRDASLTRRLRPLLEQSADLRASEDLTEFMGFLDRDGSGVCVVDIRLPPDSLHIGELFNLFPDWLFIVLGTPRSTPMRDPALSRAFAALDVESEPADIIRELRRAHEFHRLQTENTFLREQNAALNAAPQPASPDAPPLFSIREWTRIVRHFNDFESLQGHLLEELADGLQLSRAGLVLRNPDENRFSVRSGLVLAPHTCERSFSGTNPFVRWLRQHTRMILRDQLPQITDTSTRSLLQRTLNQLEADVIVPLRSRDSLLGWIFAGPRLSGKAFDADCCDHLLLYADLAAVSLERSRLHQHIQREKSLTELFIHTMPLGILFADENHLVQWASPLARYLLDQRGDPVEGKSLLSLASPLTEVLMNPSEAHTHIVDWQDPHNGRPLRATLTTLDAPETRGTLITLEDRTKELDLLDKEDRLDRGIFWSQLAASISHEVRNPLVAIKTFTQLLPERYDDPEFRSEFSELVTSEINRLDAMVDQLHQFANPEELTLRPVDPVQPVELALSHLRSNLPGDAPLPRLEEQIEPMLPRVNGDVKALSESFGHIFTNAIEALEGRKNGCIQVHFYTELDFGLGPVVCIRIRDNGPGLPDGIREDPFSPFATTKARGMGLGLAIARRTLVDHNGKVEVLSASTGTTVIFKLPQVTGSSTA